ncbi:hypothetical protein MASR2M48_14350 [Spirochaetota bacterium]
MLGPMSATSPNPDTVPLPVNYDSPKELSALLESLGLGMRKKYGQNFLISGQARRRIAALFDTAPGARVWEIGSGTGSMTREALSTGTRRLGIRDRLGLCHFYSRRLWLPARL